MIAALPRSDTADWLLLFHLLAAFVLFGGALFVATASIAATRMASIHRGLLLRRLALRANLILVVPGFVATYVLGAALAEEEFEKDPDWVEAAFPLTELGFLVGGVLLSLLQWWVLRRLQKVTRGGIPSGVATYLPLLVLAALVALIFLMSAKPGS